MGVGASVNAGFPVSQALINGPEEITDVVGFMGAAQSCGITVFLAIAGCLFNNLSFKSISSVLPALHAADIRLLTAGATSEIYSQLSAEEGALAVTQIVNTMSKIWYLFMTGGAICLVLSLFLKRTKLF
jgi:hypothetical protein